MDIRPDLDQINEGADARHDGLCDACGATYPSWLTDPEMWNEVNGISAYEDHSPRGFLCPNCFTMRANAIFGSNLTWRLVPHWRPVRWPVGDAGYPLHMLNLPPGVREAVDSVAPPQHLGNGANAEDCRACVAVWPTLAYPYICAGGGA